MKRIVTVQRLLVLYFELVYGLNNPLKSNNPQGISLKVNNICEIASYICSLIGIYRLRSLACSCPWQEPDHQHRFLVLF